MNWNLLRSLIAVKESGGVRKAARKLGVSQPALSAQLKNLEGELGVRLFHRQGRQLSLNQLGLKAIHAGYQMAEIFDTLGSEIRAASLGHLESLTFAVERDLDRPYFVQIVSRILDRLETKPLQVRIQAEFERPIADDLTTGKFDFAFTSDGPEKIGLEPIHLTRLPIVMVGALKWKTIIESPHRSRAMEQIPKSSDEELFRTLAAHGVPVIFPSTSTSLYAATRSFLEKAGAPALREIELWPMAAVTRGVTEGLGVSFVPAPFIGKEIESKQLFVLHKRSWDWGLHFYCYQSPILKESPARKAVLSVLDNDRMNFFKYQNF